VRSLVGDDFPVGVRFLGEECIRNGYTVLDAGPIAVRLAGAGADYLSLSAGGKFEDARPIEGEPLYPYTGYSGDRCMPGNQYPDGANLYLADGVRKALRAAFLDDGSGIVENGHACNTGNDFPERLDGLPDEPFTG